MIAFQQHTQKMAYKGTADLLCVQTAKLPSSRHHSGNVEFQVQTVHYGLMGLTIDCA